MAHKAIPMIAFPWLRTIYIYNNTKKTFSIKVKEEVGMSKPKKRQTRLGS